MANRAKRFIVYDTLYRVYAQEQEHITGLGMRTWGYDHNDAEQMTKRTATILAANMNVRLVAANKPTRYEVQEVN